MIRKLTGKNFSQKNIDMLEAMGVTTSKDSLKSAIDRVLARSRDATGLQQVIYKIN